MVNQTVQIMNKRLDKVQNFSSNSKQNFKREYILTLALTGDCCQHPPLHFRLQWKEFINKWRNKLHKINNNSMF